MSAFAGKQAFTERIKGSKGQRVKKFDLLLLEFLRFSRRRRYGAFEQPDTYMDVGGRATQDAKAEFTVVNETLRKCDNAVFVKR